MKVLFIGLGAIGQRHLRNVKLMFKNNVDIYAYRTKKNQHILNDNLEIYKSDGLDEFYNIRYVNSISDAINDGVENIFICNPSNMHVETLLECMKYNCKIFVEKPLCENINDIRLIKKMLKKSNSIIQIGYQYRFHPYIKNAKDIINSNILGDILFVNSEIGEFIGDWHKYESYEESYASKKCLGGGVISTQSHEIDYIYYLLGMPHSVYNISDKLSNLNMDVEDVSMTLMKYKTASKCFFVSIHQDYIQSPPVRSCKIVGVNGVLNIDFLKSSLQLYIGGKLVLNKQCQFNRNDMFVEELYMFFNNDNNNIYDALNVSEIILAIKKSKQTNKELVLKGNKYV